MRRERSVSFLVLARLPAALGADGRVFGGRVVLHPCGWEATRLVRWWGGATAPTDHFLP